MSATGPPSASERPRSPFDELYGLEVTQLADGELRARVPVREELKQPVGLVHGGVMCSIAEALASMGTFLAVDDEGKVAMGMNNNTTFLRPVTSGTLHATARVRHRGKTTWLWDVEISDDEDRLCAVTRMTIAVRERRGAAR